MVPGVQRKVFAQLKPGDDTPGIGVVVGRNAIEIIRKCRGTNACTNIDPTVSSGVGGRQRQGTDPCD